MHRPSSLLHKLENDDSHTIEKEDLQHQERLAKVLMFHSKGYSQSEIARKLNLNQSTISRDLAEIRRKARSSLD